VNSGVIALRQVEFEQKSFWRNPAAAFFSFLFPIIFLVIFATLFKGDTVAVGPKKTIAFDDYYIPALVAFGVMGACFTNIAMSLSARRDTGILKRVRGTPLPPWAFVAGVIGSSIIVSVVLALLTTGFGMLVYSVHMPQHIAAAAATIGIGALAFCALGMAMTIVIPNADAAPAIVNGVFLPIVFISGTFFVVPQNSIPAKIAEIFPVRHFINAMFTAFDPAHQSSSGFNGTDLLVMAAWGVAAVVIASLRFRWEPQKD
jgi:ABC-2 type transport system permease protein